ncbi:MAG TPA: YceI family protein [Puia sp.]|jgi:polyisoprenoid-binding protein YceI|nr:YceI family protein [Puia sp.]
MSKTAFIGFYSKTALEDIIAENQQAFAAVDLNKKQLAFAVLLKGFEFKKELMQTHFNENYVESDKYPKANFTGSFNADVNKNGDITNVQVTGNMSLHGVTKNITVPATMQIVNGKLTAHATFTLNPEDFNISIPSLVRDKIAPQIRVEVKLNADLKN